MCGICGFIDWKSSTEESDLQKMVSTLKHRGPDSYGVHFESNVHFSLGLGHTRLSIIDLSSDADQPMSYEHLKIVFNGEIYNFKSIRKELENVGHKFSTQSDTEVILHAYDEWGYACVEHFIGMFAFVVYDKKENRVILFRDRAGVKPIYFYFRDGLILFGSEMKPLIAHPKFKKTIDKNSLKAYFTYGYVPSPRAIFKDTEKLYPGSYLTIDLNTGRFKKQSYWQVSKYYLMEKLSITYNDAKDELAGLLDSAINYRMVADVPVGVFLSGGYDSSYVAAVLQKNRTEKIKTFTIGFKEGNNEAPHAREVAKYLRTDHHELVCTTKEAQELIPKLPFYFDEPFSDSSAIPTMLVSRFTRDHVKVSLSADGGDELFAGYNRYESFLQKVHLLNRIPQKLKRSFGTALQTVSALDFLLNEASSKKIRGVVNALKEKQEMSRYLSIFNDMNAAPQNYLDRLLNYESSHQRYGFNVDGAFQEDLDIALCNDYTMYLQNDILTKVDRSSMAFSLEGREPLIDHRLIEYAARLPSSFKLDQKGGKRIFKDIVHQEIPQEIMDRPKAGFSIPLDDWLRGDLFYLLEEYINPNAIDQSLINYKFAKKSIDQFRKGNFYFSVFIWRLLMFQMWKAQWS